MQRHGFNPYFTGCFSFSQRIETCEQRRNVVSILILLDASLLEPGSGVFL